MCLDAACKAMRDAVCQEACKRNKLLDSVLQLSPRALAPGVVFHGACRSLVRAVASHWVRQGCDDFAPQLVPGTADNARVGFYAVSTLGAVEADLDCASPQDIRLLMQWLLKRAFSKHMLFGSHLLLLHAIERAPLGAIVKLLGSPHVVLIASTTLPSCGIMRKLTSLLHVRVPSPRADTCPDIAADAMAALAHKQPSLSHVRSAVHQLSKTGFTVQEVLTFAWTWLGSPDICEMSAAKRVETLGLISGLAHIAAGASELDRRALETAVFAMATCRAM